MQSNNFRDRLSLWDSKLSPLTERQKDGFMKLSSGANFRPLPAELPLGEHLDHKLHSDVSDPHRGLQKYESPQQSLAWFDEVEAQVQADQESCYRTYSNQLSEYHEQCVAMVSEVNQALEYLKEMQEKHKFVSHKTGALHHACEQLMEDQLRLVNIAESLSSKLSYFNELERVSSRLNSPTMSVTADTFVAMLTRLDECISFLEQNPQFKESQVFLTRFKQYLSRALSFIKQHVVTALKNTTRSVQPKQGATEVLSENSYAQYYGKFRTNAPKIKALMKEIEERAEKSSEYRMLLQDCHQCYVSQRGLLLTPTVTTTMEELKKLHGTEHCNLVRSGCNFLSRVCQDEFQLFFHFFNAESPQLNDLLEGLCYSLYDTLRPVIIHVNHLETLAEICSILKVVLYQFSLVHSCFGLYVSPKEGMYKTQVEMLEERVQERANELAVFGGVVKQMVEDVQQRLVYRARRYIHTDIRGYSPAAGDLAYPDKLLVVSQLTQEMDSDSAFETSGTEDTLSVETASRLRRRKKHGPTAIDMHAMWYPTVRRTLLCLSKLYRCIEKPVFEGVAQEVLAECLISLQFASNAIRSKKLPVDAQLFLVKHLLIMREQIAAFDVDFAVTEVSLDWSKTRAAAYGLLKKKSRLFSLNGNNAFLEFFLEGVPEIVETHLDSKKEVDMQLKGVCEKFILEVSCSLTQPLKTLLSKYDVIFQMAEKEGSDPTALLHRQPFAIADEVHKVVLESNKLLKTQVSAIRGSLVLYLANEETEHILFRPVKASILQTHEALEKIIMQHYCTEDQYIISCPSQDQVSLMLVLEDDIAP